MKTRTIKLIALPAVLSTMADTPLSTRALPTGHYFVTVATSQATATQKLVIA